MNEPMKTLQKIVDLSGLHRPVMEDKPWVDQLLSYSGYRGAEHAFGTAYIWTHAYGIRWTRIEDFLIVRGKKSFSFPAGRGDLEEMLHRLRDWSEAEEVPLIFHGITEHTMPILEETFPGYFDFQPRRDSSDYIYLAENLIQLSGKKFHSKRNHISKFSRENDWRYEDITEDNLGECLELGRIWCAEKSGGECSIKNNPEFCALSRAFDQYFALGFEGGLIRAEGKAVAFTCGERLTGDTFVIHFEKALPGYEGAYPVINNQFAKNRLSAYQYINREEDLGIEGLRKAKLSYHPDLLLNKYLAVPKEYSDRS